MNKREWMLQAALVRLGWADNVPIDALAGVYDAIIAATPETPQEGAWVEHNGDVSKAPSPFSTVQAVLRSGETRTACEVEFSWDDLGSDEDVVRWRYA